MPQPKSSSSSSLRSMFQVQPLESRTLLSGETLTPATVLTKAMRQDLLAHWNGTNKAQLTDLLAQGKNGAFDSNLLSYMVARDSGGTGPHFFFQSGDASSIASYAQGHLSVANTITHANNVLSHLFPQQDSATTYDVQLPTGDVDFSTTPAGVTNPEFIHALNRHSFWLELADAYRYNGNTAYVDEMVNELAAWSYQNPALADPNSYLDKQPHWWLLDTSIRAEYWTWSYFTVLGSPNWTAAADTLFLYKLYQHGDFLDRVTPSPLSSNRTISHAKGLLMISEMFPEFTGAATWQSDARALMFNSVDANLYSDGSHVEQSPGYTADVLEDVLEAQQLDSLNGVTWSADRVTQVTKAINSFWQLLSPDGTTPAIGDTLRQTSPSVFFKGNLVEGVSTWPMPHPQVRDVWLFGSSNVDSYMSNPANPPLGTRGLTDALTGSGNYVMRSGNDANARQFIVDAGPKGGSAHGHFDLLNFELFGYGRPLISDPGPYKYDSSSADRQYVISTKAHNTLNVDGANTGSLDGEGNPGIHVDSWSTDNSTYAQLTATHRGYAYMTGSPVVTRSIWYDLDGTAVIVDWAEATSSHNYQISFNLQTEGNTNNVTVDAANFTARTRYPSGGNVKIQGVPRTGQTAAKGALTFVTNHASGDYKDDAYRFTVNQSGTFVCFVTLLTAYNGTTPPDTTATLLNSPTRGTSVQVQLTKGGVPQTLVFAPPALTRLDSKATSRGVYNALKYDSQGRVHLAYVDRDTQSLMYTRRETDGHWTMPIVVDQASFAPGATGAFSAPSVAIDSHDRPSIAYFEGRHGDLRYANFTGTEWLTQVVASKGSQGQYPSLAFSRKDAPVISFYNRTKHALILGQAGSAGWTFTTIDGGKSDVGRFSSLMLDPNRPTATKWAIAYSDSTNGDMKYAIQGSFGGVQQSGYSIFTVDNLNGATYESLAFYDSKTTDSRRYKPAVSYYDVDDSALKYAKCTDGPSRWSIKTVARNSVQGTFTNLYFDGNGRATIFFYHRVQNHLYRALETSTSWSFTDLGSGGREVHVSRDPATGHVAYSSVNSADMNVTVI